MGWQATVKKVQRAKRQATREQYAKQAIDQFNAKVPVGTRCTYWPMVRHGPGLVGVVIGSAWVLCGTPVVPVSGARGPIALTHVEIVE